MAALADLPLSERLFLKAYRWRRIDPVPWTPLAKPLERSRVALLSSAGLVLPDQPPFDLSIRGGDPSFREIPADADVRSLIDTQRSHAYDHEGIHRDPNLAFPLERIRELASDGRIGSVGPRHISCMGSITAPARFIRKTAPAAARLLVEDGVDVAVLVPV